MPASSRYAFVVGEPRGYGSCSQTEGIHRLRYDIFKPVTINWQPSRQDSRQRVPCGSTAIGLLTFGPITQHA